MKAINFLEFEKLKFKYFILLYLINMGVFGQKKPNILFILSDDHTSQAWGLYGGILKDYVKNDNIKRLAKNGALLQNVFCTNSICTPSRASILTGEMSHKNNVYDLSGSLETEKVTVAIKLQENGYKTALFGKWHLNAEPMGFGDYTILPGQGRYHNPLMIKKGEYSLEKEGEKVIKGYCDDAITEMSLEWLDKRDKSKPFFLCTQFKATHEPFDYPERQRDFLKDDVLPIPQNLMDFSAANSGRTHDGWPLEILGKRYEKSKGDSYPGEKFNLSGLNQEESRIKIYQEFLKDYLRAAATIDENIGKILDYLDQNNLTENTIVVYTSDQGYFLGEHGFFDKRFIYEESLRMPFVISYPKEIKAGSSNFDLIMNIDFASTFLDFAGIKAPENFQGKSFRENLKDSSTENWRKTIYYRYWSNEPERPAHLGIRTDRYKLVLFYGQNRLDTERSKMKYPPGWEFYDLKNDPKENNNLISNKKYKKRIEILKKELINQKEFYQDFDNQPEIKNILKENGIEI
jgi:arylsulfatase A-like enzyme